MRGSLRFFIQSISISYYINIFSNVTEIGVNWKLGRQILGNGGFLVSGYFQFFDIKVIFSLHKARNG